MGRHAGQGKGDAGTVGLFPVGDGKPEDTARALGDPQGIAGRVNPASTLENDYGAARNRHSKRARYCRAARHRLFSGRASRGLPIMTFIELGISPPLRAALARQHIAEPTPIQNLAIPIIPEGRDVCAHS